MMEKIIIPKNAKKELKILIDKNENTINQIN